MRKEAVIEINGLWAGYDGEIILEDINLTLYQSDFLGIIGPNGGGKTTLLKCILGLLKPFRGSIRLMGKSVQEGRCHVGYVPQHIDFDRQFPIRVWEVVQMGLLGCRKLLQPITQADRELIEGALQQVEMEKFKDRAIGNLSIGQRQRVYIARALVARPQILLLDEPTASIDPQAANTIYDLLKRLNETVAILMISHDMNAVSSYVKSIACLNRKLYYHGDKEVTEDMIKAIYECPVDIIAHGLPHRVLSSHNPQGGTHA